MKIFVITFDNGDITVVTGVDSEKEAIEMHGRMIGDYRGRSYKVAMATDLIRNFGGGITQVLVKPQ
ncbi:MAG: hypothetical protein ACFFCW_14335 [Candidatus Hodarchaeota archaeon]